MKALFIAFSSVSALFYNFRFMPTGGTASETAAEGSRRRISQAKKGPRRLVLGEGLSRKTSQAAAEAAAAGGRARTPRDRSGFRPTASCRWYPGRQGQGVHRHRRLRPRRLGRRLGRRLVRRLVRRPQTQAHESKMKTSCKWWQLPVLKRR